MNRYGTRGLPLALVLAGFVAISPVVKAADAADSEQVSQLLSDARTDAFQLKEDASTMHLYSTSNLSWQTHAAKVNLIKEHINAVGRHLAKLEELRGEASPWQKTAIDRIRPLLKELASNTEAIIEYLNKNPGRLRAPEYRDFLEANADQSEQLAALIGDFVDYGKTKQRLERLRDKLELPPTTGGF
jgi:hypothetical protein